MDKILLTNAAREERNKYMREYRRKNKQKDLEIRARYWERKALQAARTKAEGEK